MVVFHVAFKYGLGLSMGTSTLSPQSWVFTENWYKRTPVCSSLIEGRPTATACSKAKFGMKNIRWLSAAVSSGSKFWPQVLKFFPSHVFTFKSLYESLGVQMCFTAQGGGNTQQCRYTLGRWKQQKQECFLTKRKCEHWLMNVC